MKRNREKQIQINETLFVDIYRYFILNAENEEEKDILKRLQEKAEAMKRRELYNTYKSAENEEEKEKARKEYLDLKGIPDEFRY